MCFVWWRKCTTTTTKTQCAFRELFADEAQCERHRRGRRRCSRTKVTVNLPLHSLSKDGHSLSVVALCWPALNAICVRGPMHINVCVFLCAQSERQSKPLIAPILRRSVNNFWVATSLLSLIYFPRVYLLWIQNKTNWRRRRIKIEPRNETAATENQKTTTTKRFFGCDKLNLYASIRAIVIIVYPIKRRISCALRSQKVVYIFIISFRAFHYIHFAMLRLASLCASRN